MKYERTQACNEELQKEVTHLWMALEKRDKIMDKLIDERNEAWNEEDAAKAHARDLEARLEGMEEYVTETREQYYALYY